MSYVMNAALSDVSPVVGYDLYADWRVGSNSTTDQSDPAYDLGDNQGQEAWGYYQWDSNLADGFDTGNIHSLFTGSSSGQETMGVATDTPISYSGDAFGMIAEVLFQAGVLIPGTAEFSDITIQFFHDTTLRETVSFGQGPSVDTTGTPNSPQSEQVLAVTPTYSDCNKVTVASSQRLTAPAGSYPTGSDLFCDVFVIGSH